MIINISYELQAKSVYSFYQIPIPHNQQKIEQKICQVSRGTHWSGAWAVLESKGSVSRRESSDEGPARAGGSWWRRAGGGRGCCAVTAGPPTAAVPPTAGPWHPGPAAWPTFSLSAACARSLCNLKCQDPNNNLYCFSSGLMSTPSSPSLFGKQNYGFFTRHLRSVADFILHRM